MPADPPLFDQFADAYESHAADGAYNALYDRPAVLELLNETADLTPTPIVDFPVVACDGNAPPCYPWSKAGGRDAYPVIDFAGSLTRVYEGQSVAIHRKRHSRRAVHSLARSRGADNPTTRCPLLSCYATSRRWQRANSCSRT